MDARIEWITDADRFAEIADPWDALVGGASFPFCDHPWLCSWWRAFGEGSQLRVCVAWRGDEIVAAAPLRARGRSLSSMTNDHSPRYCWPARDDTSLAQIHTAVLDARPSCLTVEALPADDPLVPMLERRTRRLLHVESGGSAPFVSTAGELAPWLSTRGDGMRTLLRRRRKLEREHGAELVMPDPAGITDAEIDRAFSIEASGWKGRTGSAIISSPETDRFYREIVHLYCMRGELRLAWLLLDGEPAAFSLCLERQRRLYLLKTGFEESRRNLAPGLVLQFLTVEQCFQRDLDAYELLGGPDPWKLLLATGRQEHVRIWSSDPFTGLAHYGIRRVGAPLYRRGRALLRRARR